MSNDDTNLFSFFNLYKVRFKRLDEIVKEKNYHKFFSSNLKKGIDRIGIHINLESIFKKFYSPQYQGYQELFDRIRQDFGMRYSVTVNVLNIVSHYRQYFIKNYNVFPVVYLYYTYDEKQMIQEILPEYKKDYYQKRLIDFKENTNYLKENLKFLVFLSKYIPDLHCINTGEIDSSVSMNYFISIENNDEHDRSNKLNRSIQFVLSNNTQDKNLVNYFHNVVILKPDFEKGFIIDKKNLMNEIMKDSKIERTTGLSSYYYPIVLSIVGYDKFNISGINSVLPNISMTKFKVISLIEELKERCDVSNTLLYELVPEIVIETLIEYISKQVKKKFKVSIEGLDKMIKDLINRNYKIFNINYLESRLKLEQLCFIYEQRLETIYDNYSLEEINSRYLPEYPINLEYLL